MEHFINHFQEYLIIGLLGALFFKETLTHYIQSLLGIKKQEKTPEWGEKLTQYANHDTTERLEEIKDSLGDVNRTLNEFREYGIKIRK